VLNAVANSAILAILFQNKDVIAFYFGEKSVGLLSLIFKIVDCKIINIVSLITTKRKNLKSLMDEISTIL